VLRRLFVAKRYGQELLLREQLSPPMAVREQLKRFSTSGKSCSVCALKYTASFYGNLKFAIMDIFIMTEQPVTCPLCGARAEIIREFKEDDLSAQLCKCPEKNCQYLFIEKEDGFLQRIHKNEN
jgi:hypothetical protein